MCNLGGSTTLRVSFMNFLPKAQPASGIHTRGYGRTRAFLIAPTIPWNSQSWLCRTFPRHQLFSSSPTSGLPRPRKGRLRHPCHLNSGLAWSMVNCDDCPGVRWHISTGAQIEFFSWKELSNAVQQRLWLEKHSKAVGELPIPLTATWSPKMSVNSQPCDWRLLKKLLCSSWSRRNYEDVI